MGASAFTPGLVPPPYTRRCDGASTAPRSFPESAELLSTWRGLARGNRVARLSASSAAAHRQASPSRAGLGTVQARAGTENSVKSRENEASPAPLAPAPPHAPEPLDSGTQSESLGTQSDAGAAVGQGSAVLGVLLVAAVVGVAGAGYVYRGELNQAVDVLTSFVEESGPLGYVAFLVGYAGLEVLAVPAIPLTMSAGLLFGPGIGTVLCSASATLAATVAFLISRYVARERILALVQGNKKFLAIDRALGEDSFRVVTLLRLSPLLPFSLGNYVYGLTSIRLLPYVLGSWLGMLPGTYAYVSAGAFGRSLLEADESGVPLTASSVLPLLAGLGITVAAAAYVGNLAKNAIKDVE